jgi:hypothetical protein
MTFDEGCFSWMVVFSISSCSSSSLRCILVARNAGSSVVVVEALSVRKTGAMRRICREEECSQAVRAKCVERARCCECRRLVIELTEGTFMSQG